MSLADYPELAAWAWRAGGKLAFAPRLRAKFVIAALRHASAANRLAHPTSLLRKALDDDPRAIGSLIWPYQCGAWEPNERLDRIEQHFLAVGRLGLRLSGDHQKLLFLDLSDIHDDVSLVIDRPPWLVREGHLTLSLFLGDFRAFSVSFSLSESDLFIGGIQGRQANDVLSLYRDLTRAFCGLRPRDLLLEGLRFFAIAAGAQRIFAVADEFKISAHKYFGSNPVGLRYNDIWNDRGGERIHAAYYELPLRSPRRALDDVPAKKRNMYRRRYDMLDALELRSKLDDAKLVTFEAT